MRKRVESYIEVISEKKVKEDIKIRQKRWHKDFQQTKNRKWPFRTSQIRKKKTLTETTNLTSSSHNTNNEKQASTQCQQPTFSMSTVQKQWKRGARKRCCLVYKNKHCKNNERSDCIIKRIVSKPAKDVDYQKDKLEKVKRHLKIKYATLKSEGCFSDYSDLQASGLR